jgi:hypothetical protein
MARNLLILLDSLPSGHNPPLSAMCLITLRYFNALQDSKSICRMANADDKIGPRTAITDDELARVAEAIREGKPVRETAKELGIHRSISNCGSVVKCICACLIALMFKRDV